MQVMTNRMPRGFGGGGGGAHQRAAASRGTFRKSLLPRSQRAEALQSRLQECLVFVIHNDGSREYRTMTVRHLYNHVLEVITQRPQGTADAFDLSTGSVLRKRAASAFALESQALTALPEDTQNTDNARHPTPRNDNTATEAEDIPSARSPPPPPSKKTAISETIQKEERAAQHGKQHHGGGRKRRNKAKGGEAKDVVTYRERLGGYLHPRDMRRLVTPFSASNEPEIMVRRHVILLNCDPLRAIVLRDRLLVLVPDGADSILETIAKRIRGGVLELENDIFGEMQESIHALIGSSSHGKSRATEKPEVKRPSSNPTVSLLKSTGKAESTVSSTDEETSDAEVESDDEFEDLQGREWINMPFELQCVDAILHTVSIMLAEEVIELQEETYDALDDIIGSSKGVGHAGEDILRRIKNEMTEMQGRVQGFVRALNLVLDEEEDLALMNISRLLTKPERFIQPVPLEVLNEESDEPELILEAYLQQALSTTNQLDLMKGQVVTAEELIDMQLDSVRNRLLYINTLVSLLSLVVAIGSFIGSIFGMNLVNHLEDDPDAFRQVVMGTIFGCFAFLLFLMFLFWQSGTVSSLTG